uniref:SPOR domain-containing protein n=1 Tax=Gracilinema caldarium TaxID=215591 RepID=A0A7C3IKA9_9SPIR
MKYAILLIALVFIVNTPFQYAQTQSPPAIQTLSQELESYQKQVQDKTVTGPKKKEAWLSLAALQALSGDYTSAAASFTEAAFSVAGHRDDRALLKAALCYLYAGDLEHAQSHSKTLLLTSRDSQVIADAQMLGLLIDAFRGESSALQSLDKMAQDPARSDQKTAFLYILYTLTGKEDYANTLKKDYSSSLETAMLDGTSVAFKYAPLWLFGFFDVTSQPVAESASIPKELDKKPPESKSSAEETLLQVGLFSQQSNAQQMIDRLQKNGFKAELGKRTVNNTQYWIVTVPGGTNYNTTIMQLKDAGFEAFPLFLEK